MKKLLLGVAAVLSLGIAFAQRGKYAGTKKSLINTSFTDSRNIPALKGWTMREGAQLNDINDPEQIFADVYKKGTTWLVVLSVREDTANSKTDIYDVIEITGVQKGWSIRIGSCSRFNQPDNYIIAWGKDNQDEYMKLFKKAWRFDPDKRIITVLPVKDIKCENIGC